jgi:hypothetical protein
MNDDSAEDLSVLTEVPWPRYRLPECVAGVADFVAIAGRNTATPRSRRLDAPTLT